MRALEVNALVGVRIKRRLREEVVKERVATTSGSH
jgi:hypothetical protein